MLSESGALVAALAVVTVRGARAPGAAPAAAAAAAAVTAVTAVAAAATAARTAVAARGAGRGRARPVVRDGPLSCAAETTEQRDHIIQAHDNVEIKKS